jgi:type I restriction enzyme M protein
VIYYESLEDSANLPAPDVLAQEIADDLESALEQIKEFWIRWGKE